ncbi:MAG: hypothetical protein K2N72_02355 [Oscillospiraceae bacterium]|nr:hypothetical protein [Oscillospiraceae bacterium]
MKKQISLISLTLAVLLTLSACSSKNPSASLVTESSESDVDTIYSAPSPATSISYDAPMPSPFSDGGGDENRDFYAYVSIKLDYIDMDFLNLVGFDTAMEWIYSTSGATSELTSVDEAANLYSFIKHFDIPDETVRETLIKLRNETESDFSDEEIDLLLSGSNEDIAEYFAADTAIVKGSDIYSLKWVYYHTPDEYAACGISMKEISSARQNFEQIALTPDAKKAVTQKLEAYTESYMDQ